MCGLQSRTMLKHGGQVVNMMCVPGGPAVFGGSTPQHPVSMPQIDLQVFYSMFSFTACFLYSIPYPCHKLTYRSFVGL